MPASPNAKPTTNAAAGPTVGRLMNPSTAAAPFLSWSFVLDVRSCFFTLDATSRLIWAAAASAIRFTACVFSCFVALGFRIVVTSFWSCFFAGGFFGHKPVARRGPYLQGFFDEPFGLAAADTAGFFFEEFEDPLRGADVDFELRVTAALVPEREDFFAELVLRFAEGFFGFAPPGSAVRFSLEPLVATHHFRIGLAFMNPCHDPGFPWLRQSAAMAFRSSPPLGGVLPLPVERLAF